MISTRKSREELVICLCFEKESPGDIFIHELASGNIFGDAQVRCDVCTSNDAQIVI